jgi:hypothetical protein
LDGVDPCSILTAQQQARLGVDSRPSASRPYVPLYRGEVPTCTISGPSPDAVLLAIGLITTVGIDRWSEPDVDVEIRPMNVSGFPAVVAAPRRFVDFCTVAVDVASNQLLEVQLGGGGAQATISQDELCSRATRSAEESMSSLLTR